MEIPVHMIAEAQAQLDRLSPDAAAYAERLGSFANTSMEFTAILPPPAGMPYSITATNLAKQDPIVAALTA